MDVFVVQLRKAMFLKGWKQVDLSKATGYRDGKVSAWYNGKYRPNAEALDKIAKALGVSVAFLLGKEEVPLADLTLPKAEEVPVLLSAYFTGHKKSRIDRPFLAYLCGFCVFLCVGLSCRKIA